METGTSSGYLCANNVYTRNVSYRGSTASNGMILRCASDNLVSHNTFDGFDKFALNVVDGTQGVAYGGSIERLRILNNMVTGGRALSIDNKFALLGRHQPQPALQRGRPPSTGRTLRMSRARATPRPTPSLVSWTGYQRNGTFASPGYVSASTRDYRLTSTSPAIDRGVRAWSPPSSGPRRIWGGTRRAEQPQPVPADPSSPHWPSNCWVSEAFGSSGAIGLPAVVCRVVSRSDANDRHRGAAPWIAPSRSPARLSLQPRRRPSHRH